MARRKKHDDHINHEAWAIPYGDLVTLLLAFFVVMYAMSSVNEGKYRVLSDALVAAFRGTPMTIQPIQVGDKERGEGGTHVIEAPRAKSDPQTLQPQAPIQTGLPKAQEAEHERLAKRAEAAAKALGQVADSLEKAMGDLIKSNLVAVKRSDFWIEVEIRSDILFPSGSAQLSVRAMDVIQRLAHVLGPLVNAVRVEGHTDNRPIKTLAFFSNWELSAARAGSVVRVLADNGVAPPRLAVIGYGEQRPTHTNDTTEGRNANRRVVIVILSTDPANVAPDNAAPRAASAPAAAPGTLSAP